MERIGMRILLALASSGLVFLVCGCGKGEGGRSRPEAGAETVRFGESGSKPAARAGLLHVGALASSASAATDEVVVEGSMPMDAALAEASQEASGVDMNDGAAAAEAQAKSSAAKAPAADGPDSQGQAGEGDGAGPETRPMDAGEARELTESQLRMFRLLQKKNLQLVMSLREAEERNLRLTKALIESRDAASRLQNELNRQRILMEIQKRELREVKEQLAGRGGAGTGSVPSTQAADGAELDPLDAVVALGVARQRMEKFKLQLKLAATEDPDERNRALWKELAEANDRKAELEAMHRKLSGLVVRQHEELRQRKARQVSLEKDLTASSAREERLDEQLAVTRQKLAEQNSQLAELEGQLDTQDRQLAKRQRDLSAKEQQLARRERELSAQEERLDRLHRSAMAAAGGDSTRPVKPAPIEPLAPQRTGQPLTGKVAAVKDMVVVVNLGSEHGLKRGMRLIVYREAKLVGLLNVDEVGPGESACTFTRKLAEPRVGDRVIDRLD
jgi:hypothetical protein